jgi:hypothetical protein
MEYSTYNNHTHPVLVLEQDGTIVYMNQEAKNTFGDYPLGQYRCHYVFRGLKDRCPNFMQCTCARDPKIEGRDLNFVRESVTTKGKAFFLVEKRYLAGTDKHMECLFDISESVYRYINQGWITKHELENLTIDPSNLFEQ